MPRTMKPDESLAACYPSVAATWHPDRNGDHTPDTVSSKNTYRAWWRCPAGHDWPEIVATRTSLPGWKRGDVAACRVCTGHHVIVAFNCGHTTEAPAQYAEPERGCPDCRKVRRAEREAAGRAQYLKNSAASKQLYAACRDRAQALLDGLPVTNLPAPLLHEWRRSTLHELRGTIVGETLFGKTGSVGNSLAQARRTLTELIPTAEQLRDAATACQPVLVLGKAHWPGGWLHHLAELDDRDQHPGFEVVLSLQTALNQRVAWAVTQFGRERQLRVDDVTGFLTEAVADWAYGQETKWRNRRWSVYRELSLPVAPGGSTRFGRLDVTIMRPDGRDLVVEIDAAPNEHSIEKLQFAVAAGAVPVWVRWHGGRVSSPDDVHVVDLIKATRGLAA